jgi:energy-converting hydrogenase B subunit Q
MGAVNEADRHNIRGEPNLGGYDSPGRQKTPCGGGESCGMPAARVYVRLFLVLAGSIMGGDITRAIKVVQAEGVPVICLKMVGSASASADLVVAGPTRAGVMAVMHISSIGVFDPNRVIGREF